MIFFIANDWDWTYDTIILKSDLNIQTTATTPRHLNRTLNSPQKSLDMFPQSSMPFIMLLAVLAHDVWNASIHEVFAVFFVFGQRAWHQYHCFNMRCSGKHIHRNSLFYTVLICMENQNVSLESGVAVVNILRILTPLPDINWQLCRAIHFVNEYVLICWRISAPAAR